MEKYFDARVKSENQKLVWFCQNGKSKSERIESERIEQRRWLDDVESYNIEEKRLSTIFQFVKGSYPSNKMDDKKQKRRSDG